MIFSHHNKGRQSQTHDWCPSDTLSAYKPIITSTGENNYAMDAFNYRFNSEGFRCDEFTAPADMRILFGGCSFTEGIGLPLEETWGVEVLNRIKSDPRHTNKQIPFWSVALGGTGIDATADFLSDHADVIKPDAMFILLQSVYRRSFVHTEYMVEASHLPYIKQVNEWIPNVPSNKVLERIVSDPGFALHQAYRSLSIINNVAKRLNFKVHLFSMTVVPHQDEALSSFSNIQYYSYDNFYNIPAEISARIPKELKDKPTLARDNSHLGAAWQWAVAERLWEHIDKAINT